MKYRPTRYSTVTSPPPRSAERPPPPRRAEIPSARRRLNIGPTIANRSETSLVDVIDSLLNKGVMLNADIILGLADVDLIYLRLSALLCAADRESGSFGSRRRGSRRSMKRGSR